MQIVDLAEHLEVKSFLSRLHYGEPTVGWTGDENCTVAREQDGSWSIYRLGEDCQWNRCLSSSPGTPLDVRALRTLAERDMWSRKAYDPGAELVKRHNAHYKAQDDALRAAQSQAADAVLSQASSPSRNRQYLKPRKAA